MGASPDTRNILWSTTLSCALRDGGAWCSMGMRLSAICGVVDKHVCQVVMLVPAGLASPGTWSGDVHVRPEGGLAVGTPGLVLPVPLGYCQGFDCGLGRTLPLRHCRGSVLGRGSLPSHQVPLGALPGPLGHCQGRMLGRGFLPSFHVAGPWAGFPAIVSYS